jgi:hypothetical protein
MDPNKRLTANQLLEHPWVRGETAKSRKIDQSDVKLMTYRRHKSAVVRKVFQTMLIQSAAISEEAKDGDARSNMCLLEAAFRQVSYDSV